MKNRGNVLFSVEFWRLAYRLHPLKKNDARLCSEMTERIL